MTPTDPKPAKFCIGSLDHMHLMVPDRFEAARWYSEKLGLEICEQFREWADIEGGPLHLSADGGRTALALFEQGTGHDFTVGTWVAFSVNVEQFVLFADLLEGSGILDSAGEVLRPASVVDHDLCYAFYFDDPWGNKFELDCYDHARTKAELVEPRAITPNRFW